MKRQPQTTPGAWSLLHSLSLWATIVCWGLFACDPTPPKGEAGQEARAEGATERQALDSHAETPERANDAPPDDASISPEPVEARPEPEPVPEQRDAAPEPRQEVTPDATPDTIAEIAQDSAPDIALDAMPEPAPDDAGPAPDQTPDQVADSVPDAAEPLPDTSGEGLPESQADTTPEISPDAPPACTPATPPLTTPKEWAVSSGDGVNFVFVRDIKVDSAGFMYICGEFTGGPATFHNKTLTAAANSSQMFVLKLDAAGKSLWVFALPGQGYRTCRGLALGTSTLTITGGFGGSIPLGAGSSLSAQSTDVFVAQLDTCGQLQWVVKGGGMSADSGYEVGLDAAGNAYVYGQYNGPASFGSHTITTQDSSSVFVTKLDTQGKFLWVAKGGAAQAPDTPAGLGVTPQGDVYIAGSSFLPVTFGTTTLPSQNPFELFVAKLTTQGAYAWAMQTVGSGRIIPYRGGMDAAGNFYITGELDGSKKFGSISLTSPAHGDIFLAQVDSQGTFKWVLRPKGTSHLHPYGLTITSSGHFIAGDYSGDPTFGTTTLFGGSTSLRSFVTRASATPAFTWATNTKGSGNVRAQAIAVGPKGALFVAGNFQSSGIFGATTLQKTPFSYYMFVWKIPKP